jgi:arylsulfatase A-like enzyme
MKRNDELQQAINRRDFLKLAGLLPLGLSASKIEGLIQREKLLQGKARNVIVIVFDAFSAYDISTYGYPRTTTPNIDRLAKRAVVYHNHYAGGSFTSPGTASLLTGVLPWTNRAFYSRAQVTKPFTSKSLFHAFPNHYRISYTHNGWAFILLKQFRHDIEELIPPAQLMLDTSASFVQQHFNDVDIASVSWGRALELREEGHAYSLFLSQLYDAYWNKKNKKITELFPHGLPETSNTGFVLETAVQDLEQRLTEVSQPFLAYYHFLPPHDPYRAPKEFANAFRNDGYEPLEKPSDLFATGEYKDIARRRRAYDEFVLYCDQQFGRLYDQLESSGLLENTVLVLTSDHGEMNERNISGHMTDAMYEPLVRIPLMIFEPGRQTGAHVYETTSAVDLLPTLAYLGGQPVPDWTEGVVLPPYNSTPLPSRSLYAIRAMNNHPLAPLTSGSIMMLRENYKLDYHFGLPEVPHEGLIRLFDIQSDPEEMVELSKSKPSVATELLNELKTKVKEADQPYL